MLTWLSRFAQSTWLMTVTALPRRSFHVSSALNESEFKRVRRENRQKVSKRNAELREDWFNTQPDPFLGMQLVVS